MGIGINYYPVWKWKAGEQAALQSLYDHQWQAIKPVIEIVDQISVLEFIDAVTAFPRPIVVDTISNDENGTLLLEILVQARARGKKAIPLMYVSDLAAPNRDMISKADHIVAVIPIPEDMEGPSHQTILRAITSLKDPSHVELMLDLGMVSQREQANAAYAMSKLFLNRFESELLAFSRLIIRCSSFPLQLSTVETGSCVPFPRYDMKIFTKLVMEYAESPLAAKVGFSDLGVTKFTDSELDFSKLRWGILPKVKYTTKDHYVVLKGKRDAERQLVVRYKDMAQTIVNSDFFYGKDFSFGDREIYDISLPNKRQGSNANWVTYCANHHIAVVVDELSKLAETLKQS